MEISSAALFSTVIGTCVLISLCCENAYYRQILSLNAMLCCIKCNEKFLNRLDELFAVGHAELINYSSYTIGAV